MNRMTMTKEGDTQLKVTRHFNAPPRAVYEAHLDEAMLKQWMLGPEGWSMPHCTLDPRPGGAFSYTWESTDGEQFTIRGAFIELDPPRRILHGETMEMGDMTPPESRVETLFEADGDGTKMTMTITYDSTESREAAIASGMEEGMAVTYDRLDAMTGTP